MSCWTQRSSIKEEGACRLYNNNVVEWSPILSYKTLKDQELVNGFNEYKSIKSAFHYKNVAPKFIIKWLKNQRCNFRISYLSHMLVDGYAKQFITRSSIAMDVGNIILAYCNITFIKFYENGNNNTYTLKAFDANFSMNNLIKILELENNCGINNKIPIRIWSRFNAIRWIYSDVQNADNDTTHNIGYECKHNDRWVQIPNGKCSDLTIAEIDNKLPYNKTLEFGVDKLSKVYYDRALSTMGWSFMETIKPICNDDNRLEWLCSLSKGDIIDVYFGMRWNEAYIIKRDYDTFYVMPANYCSDNYYAVKSIGYDINRLQRRYTHCKYYEYPFFNHNTHNFNKLVYCQWITAFAHYPILIE